VDAGSRRARHGPDHRPTLVRAPGGARLRSLLRRVGLRVRVQVRLGGASLRAVLYRHRDGAVDGGRRSIRPAGPEPIALAACVHRCHARGALAVAVYCHSGVDAGGEVRVLGSPDMARFIQASHLDQARIAAYPPMGAVLAFVPRLTFWYPAIGEEGSHMKWDARYRAGSDMTVSAAAALMKAQCPDWQDARDPVLLLVNTPLPDAAGEGYRLLYSTPGRPWLVSDEVFHLYAPATFAPDFASRARDRKPLRPRKPTCQPPSAPASPSPSTRGQRAEQAYHLLTIRMVLDHVWSAPWHGWEDTLEDHYGDRERIRLFGQRPTSGSIASEKTWYRGMLCYKTNRCSSAEASGRLISMSIRSSEDTAVSESILATLKEDGVVCLPNVFGPEQLTAMQQAFNARLGRLRWNNLDGYEKTEPYRHMVEDVLTLEQGFVDAALHPIVKQVLATYLGQFALVEARGWRSLPTRRDFHGWHADEWYDQRSTEDIPKEVKLGFYLTDVRSGAFTYIKGSQRRQHPRRIRTADLPDVPTSQIAQIAGPAGTAFLFDTSGIHRQGVPLLEPRHVVFCNYHDPLVRLQKDDIDSYRYHPLILNAAFLGNLSDEDRRILGFGDKTNYVPAFDDRAGFTGLHKALGRMHDANLRLVDLRTRIATRLNRTLRKGPR
jgi:hypothetical protein